MPSSQRQSVSDGISSIKEFHQIGRMPPVGTIPEDAQTYDLNPDTLSKARQFAKEFSATEVNQLCKRIRQSGAFFGRTHVTLLLPLPKKDRFRMLESALKGGWSKRRLEKEIDKEFPNTGRGGRKVAIPEDSAGLLSAIERRCMEWERFKTQLYKTEQLSGFSKIVQRLFTESAAAMGRLRAAVTGEIENKHSRRPGRVQNPFPWVRTRP